MSERTSRCKSASRLASRLDPAPRETFAARHRSMAGLGVAFVAAAMLWMVAAPSASAHPLAPTGLHVVEQKSGDETVGSTVELTWRTPRQKPRGERLVLRIPDPCTVTSRAVVENTPLAVTEVTRLACDRPFAELEFGVSGLEDAATNAVYSVTPTAGAAFGGLLHEGETSFRASAATAATTGSAFKRFFLFGFEHLLIGFDHMLFLLGLLVLVRGISPLVASVTAFTVGHGVSVALTALTPFSAPGPPVELGIALTLVVLALRILQEDERGLPPWTASQAAALCVGFGLLHGLGLAGAFLETGIAREGIAWAMIGFNLGVEAGQLLIVAVVLALEPLLVRAFGEPRTRLAVAYLVGVAATYWAIERVLATLQWLIVR